MSEAKDDQPKPDVPQQDSEVKPDVPTADAKAAAPQQGSEAKPDLPTADAKPAPEDAAVKVGDIDSLTEEELAARSARKVRRSRQVKGAPPGPPAGPPEAEEGAHDDDDKPPEKRPRRRTRKRRPRRRDDASQDAAGKAGEDAPKGAARGARKAPPRDAKPRDAQRGGKRGGKKGAAGAGTGIERRIYRQDVHPDVAARAAEQEAAKKAAEEAKRKKEDQEKITLILHPAPKQAPTRRKKKDRPMTAKEALKAKAARRGGSAQPSERDEAQQATEAELEEGWLSADDVSAAEAIEAAGEAGEALISAWLDRTNTAAIAHVARADHLPKKVRKAARRALNVLKSRGIEIPKAEQQQAPVKEESSCVATFIPPDAQGTIFVSISQRQPGGRYHVADVVMRPPQGVVHASSAKLAGRHIRDWRNRVEKQFGAKPVDVPVDWARFLVAEARRQNDESKQLVPLGFDSCAALIEPAPDERPTHPIADLESDEPTEEQVTEAIGGSDKLHADPEFRGWMPDKPSLDELLAKIGEKLGPEGAGDAKQVDDALREEVAASTDRFFTPELRTSVAERMRDAAVSVRQRAGDEAAQRVLTVAKAVRDAGLITAPPSGIPFLLSYFQKAVAMMVRQGQGQLRVPITKE